MNILTRVSCALAAALIIEPASLGSPRHGGIPAVKTVADLVTIVRTGGLTPTGGFHSETHFRMDGSLWYSDNTNHKKARITPAELRLLVQQLGTTHFPPAQGNQADTPLRSAYDGQDVTVTLHTPHGIQSATDYQVGADINSALLKTVRQLEAKYLR